MKIDILTLFPEMFSGFLSTSIIKRAIEKKLVTVELHDFREFSHDKHKHVDDYPYGGGQGMVLRCEPIIECLKTIANEKSFIILMSPQGVTLKQKVAVDLSNKEHLIIICGHYEGFDERIRDYVDMELSIGDYVLTGGELGSMVVSDAIIRLLDGSIKAESHQDDSFSQGLLEYPQYTRPASYDGNDVPEVLLSGHHENIRKWRKYQSLKKTYLKRPDLLGEYQFDEESIEMMKKIKENDCINK
ncbi:tRNA (guanosine(37)-N1)-methyltransferase TrmD [uncultured Thomasclavelia sp.]|uniref:tRNA (guanosine(37)-N1)-methyltransferase TrmD n=1 Tax=uncultured Thomasclavelia sp. TaxID=3025759 RepID=UPI0025F70254|nr:tRNA (guanosine(37)-N1)-methyltransferase TrmD [uncultured Thomasclavelia sp.]